MTELGGLVRAIAQPMTYLAIVMIGMLWLSVGFHLQSELDAAQRAAVQNASNLARSVEEHASRTIEEADKLLQQVRRNYERSPVGFDLETWAPLNEFASGPTFQISITDRDGIVLYSTPTRAPARTDLSRRSNFQILAAAQDDVLAIGQPLVGLTTGKTSFNLSRRLLTPDGRFGGMVSISLDPQHFVRFYDSVDLGPQGFVALTGTDGVARAVGGALHLSGNLTGRRIFSRADLDRYNAAPYGWHFSDGEELSGVRHLVAHRKLEHVPLIVTVGVSDLAINGRIIAKRPSYNLIAGLITLLVLIAVGFGIRDRLNLYRAREALRSKNVWFESALENMSQGLSMFDSEQRIVVVNRRYAELYKLTPEQVRPGTTLQKVLEHRLANGTYLGHSPGQSTSDLFESAVEIQKTGDGRSILIKRQKMEDGGWMTTHEDVTEKQLYDERMAHMAHHDPLTDAANRVLLQKRIEGSFVESSRSGKGFALHLIDLDHFKSVNDTHGHPVGDQLLAAVTERFRHTLRRSDTLARIGGDEFAILQTPVVEEKDAEALAVRLRAAMAEPFQFGATEFRQTLSIGIAHAPHDSDTPEMLFKNADVALYQAKAAGRDGHRVFLRNAAAEMARSIPRDEDHATPAPRQSRGSAA